MSLNLFLKNSTIQYADRIRAHPKGRGSDLDHHSNFTKVITEYLRPIKNIYLATRFFFPLFWNKFSSMV